MSNSPTIIKLVSATRFKDWRLSFVPVIIGVVYFWLYWFKIKLSPDSIFVFLLSIITTFGFACFGYLINEFFDKKTDLKAGKINKLAFLKSQTQFLLFVLSISFMLVPWIWLPANNFSYALIATEIALFLLYSLPFPRLKNIPFISGIIDSMYAYVIPLVLSCNTYYLFSKSDFPGFFYLMSICFFITGYRNIIIHQVNDVFKDMRSGVITLPQKLGIKKTASTIVLLMIFEFGLIVSFFFIAGISSSILFFCLISYLVFIAIRLINLRNVKSVKFVSIHPIRHLSDPFFQFWFPWIILVVLISFDWRWCILLPVQVSLIISKPLLEKVKQQLRWCRRMLSLLVNYSIYYFFKIWGIDLIKENKSALGYLRYKMGKK